MPIYTLKCERCLHKTEKGFTVSAFLAQSEQGFGFLSCGRCGRKGSLSHDFMADARSQATHRDEYVFAENAPEDHLVGRTVTKREAKAILKKHGLVELGKSAKTRGGSSVRRFTEMDILDRWAKDSEDQASSVDSAPEEDTLVVDDKPVDKPESSEDTIIAKSWPALKAQAKRLGIKAPPSTKRPELERLVREQIAG